MSVRDVVVIGAGLAGLVSAWHLQQSGYSVAVVEKSRGLGGRVATRRLEGAGADHGARCLEAQGRLTQQLIQTLQMQDVIQPWQGAAYHMGVAGLERSAASQPRYGAAAGMTAIAKSLATGLEIWRNQRVVALEASSERDWTLTLESAGGDPAPDLKAKAIVMAIPAPQALLLLEPLVERGLMPEFLQKVRSVEFDPCLTAIAAYPADLLAQTAQLPWSDVTFSPPAILDWVGFDSSKRIHPPYPVFVLQSSPLFAYQHLEATDLQAAGQQLLAAAAQALSLPWLAAPQLLQVHRWRYAFVSRSLPEICLGTTQPLPLVCAGDWCGGSQIESALRSGEAAAATLLPLLGNPAAEQE